MILTAACAAAGGALAWWHWRGPWFAALALVLASLLVLAIVLPRAYAPVFAVLDGLVRLILQAITWTLLALVFAVVFIPGRVLLALLRRDPLDQHGGATQTTAWHAVRITRKPDARFRTQY